MAKHYLCLFLLLLVVAGVFSETTSEYDMLVEQFSELEGFEEDDYFPIISYRNFDRQELCESQLQELLKRGVAQWIPLNSEEEYINRAKSICKQGMKLILMDYRGGTWPFANVSEASLVDLKTWNQVGNSVRSTLFTYKANELEVDAVWCDWEGFPYRASVELFSENPSAEHFRERTALWTNLLSTYLAAPVLEHFPGASVTNWSVALGSRERPLMLWNNQQSGLFHPTFFNTTNPVAYGNSEFFEKQWPDQNWPIDEKEVDRAYLHLMLRHVSADSWNRMREFPSMKSVPWVARWVPDSSLQGIPEMSREMYREVLRHLWLRGIDGMMVFNPIRNDSTKSVQELQDVVNTFQEIYPHRKTVFSGKPLNLAVPGIEDSSLLWSGVEFGQKAILRCFNHQDAEQRVWIQLFGDQKYLLIVPPGGKWFVFER